MRITGALKTECPHCRGLGYTPQTSAEMETQWSRDNQDYVEIKTIRQGSGCPRCHGTGQLR